MSANQNYGQSSPNQPIIINQQVKKSNGVGTAGFVLALIALIFCWAPVFNWIIWFLGALLSFIGVFKSPRGLAITGLILSFIGVIIIIAVFGAIFAAFSL